MMTLVIAWINRNSGGNLAYLRIVFQDDEPNAVFGIALAETWPSTIGLLASRDEFSFQSHKPFSLEKKTVKFEVRPSYV